jgi:hypothetical protein
MVVTSLSALSELSELRRSVLVASAGRRHHGREWNATHQIRSQKVHRTRSTSLNMTNSDEHLGKVARLVAAS